MNKSIVKLFIILSSLLCFPNYASADKIPSCESHKPYAVGELGKAWKFPSDHLPIGATIGDFHIACWNILNKKYLFHIEENTQGLKDSSILKDNIPIRGSKTLTLRELTIGCQILEMINHPTHPRSLIALQETHEDVLTFLKAQLPFSWAILTPPNQPKSEDIFIYNTDIFQFISLDAVQYTPQLPKTIFTITLLEKSSGRSFRFVQSHVPGGPKSAEGCAKFSQEALRQYDPHLTTVLMGDMNQSPCTIEEALNQAAEGLNIPQPFYHLPVTYATHVNTKLEASWIDNFFVYVAKLDTVQATYKPEEVCSALISVVQLLDSFPKNTP